MPEKKKPEKDGTQTREAYSVAETAERLGISRLSAYLAIQRGEIPSLRIGRRILVPKAAFNELLAEACPRSAA